MEKYGKPSLKVNKGDIIKIEDIEVKQINLKPQDIPLDIIYEDKDIIVVNKPKGLVVHPANVNAIMNICKTSLSGIGGELRPGIVHRLDKDTSGLIMVAKNDVAHIDLSEQIKNHEVKKTYLALVRGIVKENQATINMPIARSTKDGKNAITHFKVIERFNEYTLLELQIETGRTHQIRVHMSYIGYPVVGDMVYSNGKNPFGVKGQMLHSYMLSFRHPMTKEILKLQAPLPKYFEDVLNKLKNTPAI